MLSISMAPCRGGLEGKRPSLQYEPTGPSVPRLSRAVAVVRCIGSLHTMCATTTASKANLMLRSESAHSDAPEASVSKHGPQIGAGCLPTLRDAPLRAAPQ